MRKLAVVCVVASVFVGVMSANGEANVSYTENATVSDPLVLAGEYIIDVASGVTVTYTGEISGTGPLRKTGAGTLVLNPSGGPNTFTAGVQISQGIVRADKEGALGDGEIFLDKTQGSSSYGVVRQIFFNAANATFSNNIRVAGKDHQSGGYNYGTSFIRVEGSVTLSGNIDLSSFSNGGNCNASISCGSAENSSSSLHIVNGISWAGKYLHVNAYGNIQIDGAVSLGTFFAYYNSGLTGTISLSSPLNSITTVLRVSGCNVVAKAAGVLGDAKVRIDRGFSSTTRSAIDIGGYDQRLASLWYDSGSASGYYNSKTVYVKNSSATPATLTLVGEGTSKTSYQTLSGKMSLVVDAAGYSSFTQTLAKQSHTMSGILCVSNGTLAATLGAKFANVGEVHIGTNGTLSANGSSSFSGLFASATNVVIDGTMTLGSNVVSPLADGIADLSLGENAMLTMSDSVALRVKTLTVNGNKVRNKTTWGVGGSPLAQLAGGTIIVDDGSAAINEATWTGGGADTGIATAANWSTSPETPALDDATTIATFATGGSTATVDRAVYLYGMNLSTADGFAFARSGDSAQIAIDAEGLETAAATEGHAPAYEFNVPLKAFGIPFLALTNQTWNVASGAVVRASAGILDMPNARIKKTGTGELSISGNSTLFGSFVHSAGTLRLAGTIGAPDGVAQGSATQYGLTTITVPGEVEGLTTILDGVTFYKPVWMAGRGDVDQVVNWLMFGAATTNVFKEAAVFHTKVGNLIPDASSALVFEKGVDFNSTVHFRNGTLVVKGGKMTAVTGSGFYLHSGSLRLETPLNQITFRGRSVRSVEFTVDYAITNRFFELDTSYPVVYMNGTVQHCTTFRATSGASIVAGDGPAKFIIGKGSGSSDPCYMYGSTTGHVSLDMAGAASQNFVIRGRHSDSTGDLSVSSGTLMINTDSSWRNGTNFVVRGTGTLSLTAANQLNKKIACVSISDSGVVDLRNGAKQTVKELRIDGNSLPPGTYGGADAPEGVDKTYATHFSGDGTMHVSGAFWLIVR